MVGSNRPGALASSIKPAREGGSSRSLRSALAAFSFMSSAVSTIATRQPPAPELMPKKPPSRRTSSTEITVISYPVFRLLDGAAEHQEPRMRPCRDLYRRGLVRRHGQVGRAFVARAVCEQIARDAIG